MKDQLRRTSNSAVRKAATAGQGRTVLFFAFAAALFCGVGLLYTGCRIAVVKSAYELNRVAHENRELLRERERLTMERATLRSAPRLESIAKKQLGMAPPSAAQLVVVRTAPKPAAPKPAAPAEKTVALASLPRSSATP